MNETTPKAAFVNPENLFESGPHGFVRNMERLLLHLGYVGVVNVDGPGDGGADIYALRGNDRWVFQAKWKSTSPVGPDAINEVAAAMLTYGANKGVVVTNRTFSTSAVREAEKKPQNIRLWGGKELIQLSQDSKYFSPMLPPPDPRPYQTEAFQALRKDLKSHGRALLVLATGLGKTVVAGEVLAWFLRENPGAQVLVLAHRKELVHQLERAIWRHLDPTVLTQVLTGDETPNDSLCGVTLATMQSALSYLTQGYCPQFVIVDEAHNVTKEGDYASILDLTSESLQLGVTATPWRGDGYDIEERFGEASYKLGIAEGIKRGWLSEIDYRVYMDTVDWERVRELSQNNYSIHELNRKLFLPQMDEQIRDHLLEVWNNTTNPRMIVFCQTIEHAERLKKILTRVVTWSEAKVIHSGQARRDRRMNLIKFRSGDVPVLVAVDILNEGVDIPDVNILCFARVTHSRKIFVQQLGRGVRLSPETGKKQVVVLDFAIDIRRIKALTELSAAMQADVSEDLYLHGANSVTFVEDEGVGGLLREWINDVADLESASDQARLDFPAI